jgi:hypothetical protein
VRKLVDEHDFSGTMKVSSRERQARRISASVSIAD